MLLTSDRPRNVDRYIDFFGELGVVTRRPASDRLVEVREAALSVAYPTTAKA